MLRKYLTGSTGFRLLSAFWYRRRKSSSVSMDWRFLFSPIPRMPREGATSYNAKILCFANVYPHGAFCGQTCSI